MASLIAKIQLVTVLLHLSLAVLTVQAEDEEETDLDKRIIGGRDCKPNEAPFHVVLKDYDSNNNPVSFCGGSVIHKDWVITADHCHCSLNTLKAEIDGKEVEITNIFQVPDSNRHDILLLKLPTPTKQTPIRLPPAETCAPLSPGEKVMMVGKSAKTYDATTHRKHCKMNNKLQCATTNVVKCQGYTQHFKGLFYPSIICTDRKRVDACPGDSGGAVVYNNMLYGVMVLGGEKLNALSVASMDICHKDYRKWIKDVAKV